MATWTDIPDEVLEPGKPTRSVDALALRDNPKAIAEGAPGAPRIAGQQGPAVNTGGLFDGAVKSIKLEHSVAGDVLVKRLRNARTSANGTVRTDAEERPRVVVHGTVRVTFLHYAGGGVGNTTTRVYRNDDIVASWDRSAVSAGSTPRSVDFPVVPGDEISVSAISRNVNAGAQANDIQILNSTGSLVVI